MHIQAYFSDNDAAESAAISLKALGATQIETGHAEAGDDDGLSSPLYPFPFFGQSGTVLLGAGEWAEPREEGIPVLSAVVADDLYEEAVKIVKHHGGHVN
jgi:hypothetical protein